jgi:hypothetical protein
VNSKRHKIKTVTALHLERPSPLKKSINPSVTVRARRVFLDVKSLYMKLSKRGYLLNGTAVTVCSKSILTRSVTPFRHTVVSSGQSPAAFRKSSKIAPAWARPRNSSTSILIPAQKRDMGLQTIHQEGIILAHQCRKPMVYQAA